MKKEKSQIVSDTDERRVDLWADDVLDEAISQALKIAKERVEILEKLKCALWEDDIDEIRKYAKRLCGLAK